MSPSVASSISSIEVAKAGVKTETAPRLLSEYVDEIAKMSVEDGVNAMSDLVQDISSYISYGGKRCVKHPKYKGTVDLRHLGRTWMNQGSKCCDENATFPVRLKQHSLLRRFKQLLTESNRDVKRSKVAWLFTPFRDFRLECGCCSRDPLFCIPFGEGCDDALQIRREVYEKYWPEHKKLFWGQFYSQGRYIEVTFVKIEELEDMVAKDNQQKVES